MNDDFFKNIDDTNKKPIKDERYDYTNGTEKNINFFLTYAKILKTIAFIGAGIMALLSITIGLVDESGILFVLFLVGAIILVIVGILIAPFLEWKAYMLKNIYELNNKKEK